MKTIIFTALATCLVSGSALAQRFQQEAMLVFDDAEAEQVWIAAANKTKFAYFSSERAVDSKEMRITKPSAIWLMEPPEYTKAMELYQARKYEEARAEFAQVRQRYIKLRTLPNNHSAQSAFFEMECLRRLGKLDELVKLQELFLPDDRNSMTRTHRLRQIELYVLWDAVRSKAWPRLELMCREKLETKMPGYQRAQLGYCLGLALEGQNKPIPAINAYNIGMTADTGASERITSKGALNSLRLYSEDELVKLAIKLHGTPDEEPDSLGMLRLEEAASLASLYDLTLGAGDPLPSQYQGLLKYLSDSDEAAAPAPKKEEPKKTDKEDKKEDAEKDAKKDEEKDKKDKKDK